MLDVCVLEGKGQKGEGSNRIFDNVGVELRERGGGFGATTGGMDRLPSALFGKFGKVSIFN